MSDRDIRRLFERNAPYVDESEVWAGVRREIARRSVTPRRAPARHRVVVALVAAVLIVSGVSAGIVQAVKHIGVRESVVVIGEPYAPDTTTAAATGTTAAATETTTADGPTTTAGATETTATAGTPYSEFTPFIQAWQAKGIEPLAVVSHPTEPRGLTLKVPESLIAPPEGIFARHQITRQAFLVTQRRNLPYDWLDIVTVDQNGREVLNMGFNPQAGYAFAKDWSSGETLGIEAAQAKAAAALRGVADAAGVIAEWSLAEADDGRTLRLWVTLPRSGELEAYDAFLARIFAEVIGLNGQGCLVAVFELGIDDADNGPVLRDVHDFELGSLSSWHTSEGFRPPWIDHGPYVPEEGEGG